MLRILGPDEIDWSINFLFLHDSDSVSYGSRNSSISSKLFNFLYNFIFLLLVNILSFLLEELLSAFLIHYW